ncbi:MAG: LrgB family protein [Suipraeoptans sp.]
MNEIWSNPLFGFFLTIICFLIGTKLSEIVKIPIANPLLIGIILCFLKLFKIELSAYLIGADIISAFLVPVSAVLGLSIYRQRKILKKDFSPIVMGCLIGSIVSVACTIMLCKLFRLDEILTASLIPKSVTTVIAVDLSEQLGGLRAITVLEVSVCGIGGALIHPLIIKIFKLNNKVARGVAIGASSHAVGTSQAIKMGEVEGAISGVSIGITGILMVIIALFL